MGRLQSTSETVTLRNTDCTQARTQVSHGCPKKEMATQSRVRAERFGGYRRAPHPRRMRGALLHNGDL